MIQKKFKTLFLVMMIFLITISTFSYAENDNSKIEDNSENSNTETTVAKEDDVLLTGSEIIIDQEVQGNVYIVATNSVTVTAPIYGNAYIFSKNVEFKSSDTSKPVYVSGSVFLYGTDINLSLYCQDLYVYSPSSLTINYDSCILRDIRGYSPIFNLYGIVKRNVFIESANISLQNDKNEKGLVEGNLSYYNSESLDISEELVVGEVYYNEKTIDTTPQWLKSLYTTIVRFVCSVLFLFLLTRITPSIVNPEKGFVLKKFLGTILYGILMLVVVPTVCLIVVRCATRLMLFAIPIIFIYGGLIIISFFASIIYLAGLIKNSLIKKNSIWIAIGLLFAINIILYLASFITIVALILAVILVVLGFGLFSQELFKKKTIS